ncbi:MAG TPA: DMT family transporter [Demequinaceae bacterium]
MNVRGWRTRGIQAALASALLFGAGTPLAKILLADVSPWMLAGLLYAGSGIGLGLYRLARRAPRVRPRAGEWLPLAGAILCGGVAAPVLLFVGLSHLPASGASLLLNAESVFTALIAWWVFKENRGPRVVFGFAAIVAGAAVLAASSGVVVGGAWPSIAVLAACLLWGVDNNLTRAVSRLDAVWLAALKGSVAGGVNLSLAFALGSRLPGAAQVLASMALGLAAYGVSLVLFIVALRKVGTARAGAYFAVAPFFGALVAFALGDAVTFPLAAAGLLMATGVWLHVTERHDHLHWHPPTAPYEAHTHDEFDERRDEAQGEARSDAADGAEEHRHAAAHAALSHRHGHYPDTAHRHTHER